MRQLSVQLIESNSFDVAFNDDERVIVFKGDLTADESLVQDKLYENERFKNSSEIQQSAILDTVLRCLFRNSEFCKKNEKLFTKMGYACDSDITWNQFIPIRQVLLGGEFHNVDTDELTKLGYGITRLSISNYKFLSGRIKCAGKHPNVSSAGNLCTVNIQSGEPLSVESVEKIKLMLLVANLDNAYCPHEVEEIKRYIR